MQPAFLMRSLATEAVLPEPLSVLPGSNFVQWPRIREDDKGIKIVCCWEMLSKPLRQNIVVNQAE